MSGAVAVPILVVLVSLVALEAQDSRTGPPRCYALELGEWRPPLMEGNEPYQTPPMEFVLHGSVGTSLFERGRRLVRPVIQKGRTPSAFWEPLGSDSIQIVWTNGFAGVIMRLGPAPDGLRGTAIAFTDVLGRERPTAAVMASRIDCRSLIGS